jgi:D-alanyl-D-alanine carboxypeptidase
MSYSQPARTARGRTRSTFFAVLIVVAVLMGVVGCRSPAGLSSGASPSVAEPSAHLTHKRLHGDIPGDPPGRPQGDHHHGLGVADGEVPDGVTVFDCKYPAVAKLDPALLAALRKAATDAGGDGVDFYVNSGWRSSAYQKQLLDEAVSKYGSRAQAARWVATPATSPHVSGDAVDIADSDGTTWLSDHGADYGLCQIYRNEPWHYELRPKAVDHGCPAMYADPTYDPRMRR